MSCFPAFAQAQSSAEVEYQDAPPTVPGDTGGSDAKDKEPSAQKANADDGGGGSGSAGGGSGKGGSSDKAGNGPGGEGGQQGNQGRRGGEGSDAAGQDGAHAGAIEPVSEEGGGSSPLVPILIAIAVLAAISIGVVVMRQRRGQDASPGTPASPEAG